MILSEHIRLTWPEWLAGTHLVVEMLARYQILEERRIVIAYDASVWYALKIGIETGDGWRRRIIATIMMHVTITRSTRPGATSCHRRGEHLEAIVVARLLVFLLERGARWTGGTKLRCCWLAKAGPVARRGRVVVFGLLLQLATNGGQTFLRLLWTGNDGRITHQTTRTAQGNVCAANTDIVVRVDNATTAATAAVAAAAATG